MPEPTKIPRPFADSGDKNTIPESSGALGFASWQEGFPAITGTPFAQGGVAPKRADFNGIFNAISAAIVWAQQGGVYAYDNATDYEVGNIVEYGGDLYKCITTNGPSSAVKAPTDATVWAKVILTNATTSADGYMSAADKVKCDGALTGTTTYTSAYSGGNYYLTKHSNGLMILAGNAKITTTSAYGGVTYYFPQAFMQNPAFTVTSKNYYNFYVPGISTTSLSLGFRNLDGTYPAINTEIEFYFIVVGMWS